MAGQETIGSIGQPSNYASVDYERPEFIRCVDRWYPQIHEVWDFGEDSVTREFHPTERVDFGTGFVGEFTTDYLTKT